MPTVTHIIDANLPVYATGNQTISGKKTFTNKLNIFSGESLFSEPPDSIKDNTLLYLQSSGKALVVIEADTYNTTGNNLGELYNPGIIFLQDGRQISGSLSFLRNNLELKNSWTGIPDVRNQGKLLLGTKDQNVFSVNLEGNIIISTGIDLQTLITTGTTDYLLMVDGAISGKSLTSSVDINNITTNFNFNNSYNSKLLTINATQNITGTIPIDLQTGYNIAFVQMGVGQLRITGQNGITIRQRLNLYNTAGQYAIASLVHRGNNEYILYGDLA